jgi:hypothetical protein
MSDEHPMVNKLSKIVFGREYKDELDKKILNNKILWLIFLILFLWNSFATYGYLSLRETNHVKLDMPAINYHTGTIEVGNNFANEDFYMAWGMYDIIQTFVQFDKKNISQKMAYLANKMTEDAYLNKKEEIDNFILLVDENNIKGQFRIPNDNGWAVNKNEEKNAYGKEVYTVSATGEMVKHFGSSYIDEPKKCTVSIEYFRKGGLTYVENFASDCF